MIYSETWGVARGRIEEYFASLGAESAGGGVYSVGPVRVCVSALPDKKLAHLLLPQTLVEMSGPDEQTEALHQKFFLRFLSAGG